MLKTIACSIAFTVLGAIPVVSFAEDVVNINVDTDEFKKAYEKAWVEHEVVTEKSPYTDREDALQRLKAAYERERNQNGTRSEKYKELKALYNQIKKDKNWEPPPPKTKSIRRPRSLNWTTLKTGQVGHICTITSQGKEQIHNSPVRIRCIQSVSDEKFLGEVTFVGGATKGPYLFVGIDDPVFHQDGGWKWTHDDDWYVSVVVAGQIEYTTVLGAKKRVFVIQAFDPPATSSQPQNATPAPESQP